MTPKQAGPVASPVAKSVSTYALGLIAWTIGLLGLTVLAVWGYTALGETRIRYAPGMQIAICIVYVVVYGLFMRPLQQALSDAFYYLAVPEDANKSEDKPPVQNNDTASTRTFANIIALSIVIGSTLIVLLLAFDYLGHANIPASPADPAQASGSPTPHAAGITAFLEASGPRLGTFGDFFGGVVNPLLTFGTLVGLAITILLQRIQIREARAEATASRHYAQTQAFETTFFHLLNLHAENIQNLTFDPSVIRSPRPPTLNRPLAVLLSTPTYEVEPAPAPPPVHGRAVFGEILRSTKRGTSRGVSQLAVYRRLQREHNEVLGHYFRNLYQILNLVNSFAVEGTEQERYRIRKRYTNILRAQMSTHELAVLLLNCTFGTVDDGKFRNLLIWWKFLEHLPMHARNGALVVRDIDLDIQWIVFDYFSTGGEDNREWLPGAFGKHPAVATYLSQQGPNWQGPVPWHAKPVKK